MKILAIETSCDETAAAVVEDGTKILSNVIASSTAMHQKYGGIVPEVAAREQLQYIWPVIKEALQPLSPSPIADYRSLITDSIDAIAVTVGPGLIGSLLVGVETAKTLSFITGKPLIPVNHVLAHMYANFVDSSVDTITFPTISLVVSGGHTELFLMKNEKELVWLGGTLDDAAGEAFDKTARLLGFQNGGGPAIQKSAAMHQLSHKSNITLPRPMMHDETLNFSFSGLKTAILREVNKLKNENKLDDTIIHLLSHEVQESITDVLVFKTLRAAKLHKVKSILLSGGVAANLRLREKMHKKINDDQSKINLFIPPVPLCTDNAAYIGAYAFFRGKQTDWHDITAIPDLSVEKI